MAAPVRLPIALIYPSDSARALDKDKAAALAGSMKLLGLRCPITVKPAVRVADGRDIDAYEIVAGHHRYEAACRLGWTEIDCDVMTESDLKCALWEIDENLMRAELTPADLARCTARRKEIYEQLHPETVQHVAGAHGSNRVQGNASANLAPAFTADTAARTGRSERAVQRDAERGEKVALDVLEMVAGTALNTGTYLDALKRLSHDEQRAKVRADLDAAREARTRTRQAKLADDPLNDFEAREKQVARLMSAWNAASQEARQSFMERIDRPVFDNTRSGRRENIDPSTGEIREAANG